MSAEWELLRGLFEGALARPKHERAAFLDEHTKDDPSSGAKSSHCWRLTRAPGTS